MTQDALRKGFGPSKSHPSILALIVKKMTLEMPLEKGWTFEILACNTGFNCKGNDPRNALRTGFGPSKSHVAISVLIIREMTLVMP